MKRFKRFLKILLAELVCDWIINISYSKGENKKSKASFIFEDFTVEREYD